MYLFLLSSFFFHFFLLWLENVENPNNNKSQLLIFTQKIKEPLSTRVNACLEASIYKNRNLKEMLPR